MADKNFHIEGHKPGVFPKALMDMGEEGEDFRNAFRMGVEVGVNAEGSEAALKQYLNGVKVSDEWKDWFSKGFKKGLKLGS